MNSNDDLTSQIIQSLGALPPEDQTEVILGVINAALKGMSIYRVLQVRMDIANELDPEIPLVTTALEVIDGHIALREISGSRGWR